MTKQTGIGIGIVILFLLGAGYIVFQGRPVVELKAQLEEDAAEMGMPAGDDADEMEVMEDEDEETVEEEAAEMEQVQQADHAPTGQTNTADVTPTETQPTEPSGTTTNSDGSLSFTAAVVESHNTPSDCWSSINGSVYDLTTWISRHPGGSRSIERLCGTDGSSQFNRTHGKSKSAQSALALLKIGTVAQ